MNSTNFFAYYKLILLNIVLTFSLVVHSQDVQQSFISNNPNYDISLEKSVGIIPCTTTVTDNGTTSVNVPISVYQDPLGMSPNLSLTYSQYSSYGFMGQGWTLVGSSIITHTHKSYFYDGLVTASDGSINDALSLDGVRLMKIKNTQDKVYYQSFTGNISVIATIKDEELNGYEVRYPDGSKAYYEPYGMIAYRTKYVNRFGREINYYYDDFSGHKRLNYITYGKECQAKVLFNYKKLSPNDTKILYSSLGTKIIYDYLLNSIEVFYKNTLLKSYLLSYTKQNDTNLLSRIDFESEDQSLNPLLFYYGVANSQKGSSNIEIDSIPIKLTENSSNVLVRGKFDYGNDNDGIIIYPNKVPYSYYSLTNTYKCNYSGTEIIKIISSVDDKLQSDELDLTVGKGFVEVIAAPLDSECGDEIIKINDICEKTSDGNYQELVSFSVYHVVDGKIKHKYDRTYPFYTPDEFKIVTKGGKGRWQKKFLVGDYDGDGRNEMLVLSTSVASGCMIIDLEENNVLYKNVSTKVINATETIPNYAIKPKKNQTVADARYEDLQNAYNCSDKFFVCDYNCDGKSELFVVAKSGYSYLYAFVDNGGNLECKKLWSNCSQKIEFTNRRILLGEFNGDGLCDIIVSPRCDEGSSLWTIFANTGGPSVREYKIDLCEYKRGVDFFLQDMDLDGQSDLIKRASGYLNVSFISDFKKKAEPYDIAIGSATLISPIEIQNENTWYSILTITPRGEEKWCYAHKYRFNEETNYLLTKTINSIGVVTSLKYGSLNNQNSDIYSQNMAPQFPYSNFKGCMKVVTNISQYFKGEKIGDTDYNYENAIIHRQGLGFCGFSKICFFNNITKEKATKTYNPCNFSTLVSYEDSHSLESYNYSVSVGKYKTRQINLMSKMVLDKSVNVQETRKYTYDHYGNVNSERLSYKDNDDYILNQYCYDNIDNDSLYLPSLLRKTSISKFRDKQSFVDEHHLSYCENHQIKTDSRYVNSSYAGSKKFVYENGLLKEEYENKFLSTEKKHTVRYEYDEEGRKISQINELDEIEQFYYNTKGLQDTIVDKLGNKTYLEYDALGRIVKERYADGTEKNNLYLWSNGEANSIVKTIVTQTGNKTKEKYYDIYGNIVRESELCFDGSSLKVDKVYDKYNRLIKESTPYKGTTPSKWTLYSYDAFGRLIEITYPSGKTESYCYSGLNTEITIDGHKTIKTYDAFGFLNSVTDNTGTISYEYTPNGDILAVQSIDGELTVYEYDNYGRCVSMSDPTAGQMTITYDCNGNVSSTKDSRGKQIKYSYDGYDRLVKKELVNERLFIYAYDEHGRVRSIYSPNGVRKTYTFDKLGRLYVEKNYDKNDNAFQKVYWYSNGSLSAVGYYYNGEYITSLRNKYTNGVLTSLDTPQRNIYKRIKENEYGHETVKQFGVISSQTKYDLDNRIVSLVTSDSKERCIQNYFYDYDNNTGNMLFRNDRKNNLVESFEYDDNNRLVRYGQETVEYEDNGNIENSSRVGAYDYALRFSPYNLTSVDDVNGLLSSNQKFQYNSLGRVSRIEEGKYVATFDYDSDGNRTEMQFVDISDSLNNYTKYYYGDKFEVTEGHNTKQQILYLGGDPYSANAICRKVDDGEWEIYYLLRDHLGSITAITDTLGNVVQELSYDAWGNIRDPQTWELYDRQSEPKLFIDRGFTSHEHLQAFGLINMNARLYCPVLCRFINPDPYVQNTGCSQSFNRFAYCNNNPLSYVDPDGKVPALVFLAVAVIGGGYNLYENWDNVNDFWSGFGYFVTGAAVAVANTVVAEFCPQFYVGALNGAASGFVMGGISGFVTNGCNNVISGGNFFENGYDAMLGGSLSGMAMGALYGGMQAYSLGCDWLTGQPKMIDVPTNFSNGLSNQLDELSSRELGPQKVNGLDISNDISTSGTSSRLPANFDDMTPYQKGQWGVRQAIEDLHLEDQPFATEVSFRVEGLTYRADVVYQDKSGVIHIVEVKTGPHAGFTSNQKFTIPAMQERHPVITPFGKNAIRSKLFDIPLPAGVSNYSFDLIIIK